jgi:predicted nucleotide-binding protein (sugar kinase/HSP70/actin superfamily)
MAHGHIQALIDAQVPIIFYPGVVFEQQETVEADNHKPYHWESFQGLVHRFAY